MRLSDPLPLRSSTEWREYQISQPIPLRYGRDVWGECLPYSQDLTRWVWAAHPSQGIDQVTVDGIDTAGWNASNTTDSAGKPITLIVLTDAIDPGRAVHARGRGAINAETGALIDSPAAVLQDLARIHGVALTRNDLTELAQECAARNLRLSFSVSSPESPQAIARRMAEQLCAVYSPSLTGWLRLLPLASTYNALVSATDADLSTAVASLDSMATRIRARYAYRLDEPTQSIEIRAQGAVDDVAIDLDLTMLSDATAVFDVARRTLQRRARRPYTVSATIKGRHPPGSPVALQSAALGVTGTVPVINASYTPASHSTECALEVQVSTQAIVLQLLSSSEQITASERSLPPSAAGSGDQSLSIMGPNGPRVGARVTLDERTTRVTDSAGRVTFAGSLLPPGTHTLDIEPVDAGHYRQVIVI